MTHNLARERGQSRLTVSLIKEFSTSMTRTKSIGGKGSPWRSPRPWIMQRPGLPFSSTRVLAVESSMEIQPLQRREKPMCWSTSRRKGQPTESNALAML